MIKSIKRNIRRIQKPISKLLGITDTTLTKIANNKYTPQIAKNTILKTQSYSKTVIQGRNDYQPKARSIIKKYGNTLINEIEVIRQPIQSFINTAFNFLTKGQFNKKLKETPYDKLFHLRIVITLDDKTKIQIEKNEVINITLKIDNLPNQEAIKINLAGQLSFSKFLQMGQEYMGNNYFPYHPFNNNCQDYIIGLLTANNLLNDENKNFIKQDVSELAKINKNLSQFAKFATDLGGKVNEIIHGTNIKKPVKNKLTLKSINMHHIKSSGKGIVKIPVCEETDSDTDEIEGFGKISYRGGDLITIGTIPPIGLRQYGQLTQQPPSSVKPTNKILKSKNKLLNNLTSEDILDLRTLFTNANKQEVEEKNKIKKIRKSTLARIKSDKPAKRTYRSKLRGTTEGKEFALEKHIKTKRVKKLKI